MIRYCSTSAGRIAYSMTGAGPALLCDSGWITHLRGQLELYAFGRFIERLAERFTVIRYDKPGCDLSDRDGDLSFSGQHVENIRRKLQVRSRAQIAAWVTEQRLSR